jgi:hypothetical protein
MSIFVLLIVHACGGVTGTPSTDECALKPLNLDEACPISSCATECSSEAAAIECCVEGHGRGLSDDALEDLNENCTGDACEDSIYMSEAAALCLAQYNGLESGVDVCRAKLRLPEEEPALWEVWNTIRDQCTNGSSSEENEIKLIDALAGKLIAEGTSYSDGICE